jgi:hypothetical protein
MYDVYVGIGTNKSGWHFSCLIEVRYLCYKLRLCDLVKMVVIDIFYGFYFNFW